MPESEEITEDRELEALLQKIFEERGMDFREYKRTSLRRSIQKRLDANNLGSYADYMKFLDSNPNEYAKLFDTLLINVTEFFRDPEAFEVLRKKIIPAIISKKKKGDSIRIWSAGCASGEEPYSLGILLAEKLGEAMNDYEIRIYATDIDENAIAEARRGIYSESKLKNVRHEYLDKYFSRENDDYRVNKTIRHIVFFGRQNLTSDAPISHLDLIVCRNVLIYFNLELQNKILMRFHYALNRDGYLFLGKSESMLIGSRLFNHVDKKWRLFQKSSGSMVNLTPRERKYALMEDTLIDQAIRDARKELKLMEFYNESIIQNISLGIIVIDSNNIVTTWNHVVEEFWMINAENAIGRDFFELGMGERLPNIKERIDELARERKNIKIEELGVIDYRGEKMFLDIMLVPLTDPNNEIRGVIITSSDVTDYKMRRDELKRTIEELRTSNEELETTTEELQSTAEELETSNEELQSTNEELETTNEELKSANEELEASNEELREMTERLYAINLSNKTIIESMNQSLVVLNSSAVVMIWNPASEDMWGIKEEDALGKSIFNLAFGIESEELRKKIGQAVEGKKPYNEALEHTPRSGEKRFMELTIIPLMDVTGKHTGTMLLSQDVMGKKRKAVKEAYEYAFNITSTVHEPVIILDAQLQVIAANQPFYNAFRVSPGETEGRLIYKLGNYQWDIPELRRLLEEIIPRDSKFHDFEVEHEFPEIGRRKMLLNARRVYHEGAGVEMIFLTIEDITERNKAGN